MKYAQLNLALLIACSVNNVLLGMEKPDKIKTSDRKLPSIIQALCDSDPSEYHCKKLRRLYDATHNADGPFQTTRTSYDEGRIPYYVKTLCENKYLSEQTIHQQLKLTRQIFDGKPLSANPQLDWQQEKRNKQKTNQQLPNIVQELCNPDLDEHYCKTIRQFHHAAHHPNSPFKKASITSNGWDDIKYHVTQLCKEQKLSEQTTHQQVDLTKRTIDGKPLFINPPLNWQQEKINKQKTNQALSIEALCENDLDNYYCRTLRQIYYIAHNPNAFFENSIDKRDSRDWSIKYHVKKLGKRRKLSKATITALINKFQEDLNKKIQTTYTFQGDNSGWGKYNLIHSSRLKPSDPFAAQELLKRGKCNEACQTTLQRFKTFKQDPHGKLIISYNHRNLGPWKFRATSAQFRKEE